MGTIAGFRRAKDASRPVSHDQTGGVPERNAAVRDSRSLRVFAGAFRDPVADVQGLRHGRTRLDPDRLSFTVCFQILKCRLTECDRTTPKSFEAWYRPLCWEMQLARTEPRR